MKIDHCLFLNYTPNYLNCILIVFLKVDKFLSFNSVENLELLYFQLPKSFFVSP